MSQQSQPPIKEITFGAKELDPDKEAAYYKQIADARAKNPLSALKGSTPVGHVERPQIPRMGRPPSIDDVPGLTPEGGVAVRPSGSPILSAATQSQLEAMGTASKVAESEAEKKSVEEEAKKAVEDKKEELFDMFDFGGQNEAERVLNNKKRRQEIEKRCEPMAIEDLLMRDEVRQLVQIVPDKFFVVFRSLTPEESLFIKQILAREQAPSDSYALEKYSLLQLACSVVSINGKEFTDHRNKDGDPQDDLFKLKMKQLMKKSGYVINDLGINYMWFDIRVRKLLTSDTLGNG